MRTIPAVMAVAILSLRLAAAADAPARPNVLILFADDQRADTIAALGNPVIKTPNLDRLVRRGVSFDRACIQGAFTPAPCVPSRAMLVTGRSLFHPRRFPAGDNTWPAAFGRAGSTRFVSGKWHNSDAMLLDGFQVGDDPDSIPLPRSFLPQHPWDNGDMTIRDERLLPWSRTPGGVRRLLADYCRYVSYLDLRIGRVLDALVYRYDLLTTLGGMCGAPGPAGSEGIDFSASVRDPARPARRTRVFAYGGVQRAICEDRWKLIRYPQVDRTQLFDLRDDPHESKNLADDPAHAARVAELTALLERELRAAGSRRTSRS